MLQRSDGDGLRAKLVESLANIGWTVSQDGLLTTPDALISEQFFPSNSEYDAYLAIRDILATARSEIVIVDAYVGSSLLLTLKSLQPGNLTVRVLTTSTNIKSDFCLEVATFNKQVSRVALEIRTTSDFHDRFIVVDGEAFYHVSASIKDAGRRAFMISRIEDQPNVENARQAVADAWAAGTPFQSN